MYSYALLFVFTIIATTILGMACESRVAFPAYLLGALGGLALYIALTFDEPTPKDVYAGKTQPVYTYKIAGSDTVSIGTLVVFKDKIK